MITAKTIFLCISMSILVVAQAQTQEIAHKSHSGSAATMYVEPQGNLGGVEDKLLKIERISTKKVVYVWEQPGYDKPRFDTVAFKTSNKKLKLVYDSLRARYPEIELINFEKNAEIKKTKKTSSRDVPFMIASVGLFAGLLLWYYRRDLA